MRKTPTKTRCQLAATPLTVSALANVRGAGPSIEAVLAFGYFKEVREKARDAMMTPPPNDNDPSD